MGSITGCTSPMESTYSSGTIGDVHPVIDPRNLSMHADQHKYNDKDDAVNIEAAGLHVSYMYSLPARMCALDRV